MSKAEPMIQKFMTVAPFSIEADQSMEIAIDLIAKYKIRHLPVMNEGKVVGLISDRDLKLASGIEGVDPKTVTMWARKGKLPHTTTLGGHRRYKESVVREVLGLNEEEVQEQ